MWQDLALWSSVAPGEKTVEVLLSVFVAGETEDTDGLLGGSKDERRLSRIPQYQHVRTVHDVCVLIGRI